MGVPPPREKLLIDAYLFGCQQTSPSIKWTGHLLHYHMIRKYASHTIDQLTTYNIGVLDT